MHPTAPRPVPPTHADRPAATRSVADPSRRRSSGGRRTWRRRPDRALLLVALVLVVLAGLLPATTASATGAPRAATGPTAGPAALGWEVIELDPIADPWPGRRGEAYPAAINAAEVVVGRSDHEGSQQAHAFVWQPGIGTRDLTPGYSGFSIARDVSDAGLVVGQMIDESSGERAVVWRTDGTAVELDAPGGRSTDATAINERGMVVGGSHRNWEDFKAVVWSDAGATEIEPLPGQTDATALDVDEAGRVLGYSGDHGFLWFEGVVTDLGPMSPTALNDRGDVAANRVGPDGLPEAFVREADGTERVLPRLRSWTHVQQMSSRGDSVGVQHDSTTGPRAALWPAEGGAVDLNDVLPAGSGWVLHQALAIGDDGTIAGIGLHDGERAAFVLRPAGVGAELVERAVEHPEVPTGGWVPVAEEGAHEGDPVRFRHEVRNPSGEPHVVEVEVRDAETGARVPDMWWTDALAPGESATVTFDWDTEGRAWNADGTPAPPHRFEVVVTADGEEKVVEPFEVAVRPRPLVLVHGFNADASTWERYPQVVHAFNPAWELFAVGDGQAPGAMDTGSLSQPWKIPNTVYANAEIMAGYVDAVRDALDVQHVDLVAHSMGGLISREYVQTFMPDAPEGRPAATRLVMLGTPNHGSPCAAILPLAGMYELRPEAVEEMNARVTDRRGVEMSVLAGDPLPFTCQQRGPGDGVVAVPSALTGWEDTALSDNVHTELTGYDDFAAFVAPRLIPGAGPSGPAATSAGPVAGDPAPLQTEPATQTQLALTDVVEVPAHSEVRVPVPVTGATGLGATALAAPEVSATLLRPSGAPGATPAAGTERLPFRTLAVAGPEAGTWQLVLRNDAPTAAVVPVSVWVDGSDVELAAAARPSGTGGARITATLTRDGRPVEGASAVAVVRGADGERTVALADLGAGRFEAPLSGVEGGGHVVAVTASTEGVSRTVVASFAGDDDPAADTTAPTVTVTPLGDGWSTGPLTVRATGDDADGRGVATIEWSVEGPAPGTGATNGDRAEIPVTADGVTTVTVTAVDAAGNRSEPVVVQARIDASAPSVAVTSPTDGASYEQGADVVVRLACADAGSGIARCDSDVPDGGRLPTSVPGTHQLRVTAVDHAGHTTTQVVSYRVVAPSAPDSRALLDQVEATVRSWKLSPLRTAVLVLPADLADSAVALGRPDAACRALDGYDLLIPVATLGRWITRAQATDLRGRVAAVEKVLGC